MSSSSYMFPFPISSVLRIDFKNEDYAGMVKTALEVDEEIQPTKISKDIQVDGTFLVV